MKVCVFGISHYIRHGADGPVLLQPVANVAGPTAEEAVEFFKDGFDGDVVVEVTGISNIASDVLIPDPGRPAPSDDTALQAAEAENAALKAKIAQIEADLDKLHNHAT
jgi:hypothetical protein